MDRPVSLRPGGIAVTVGRGARQIGRDLAVLTALLSGLAGTLVWLVTLQRHFLILIGLWAALALAGLLLLRAPAVRGVFLSLAAITATLFLAEAAATLLRPQTPRQWLEGMCPTGGRFDPYLVGYGPREPVRASCRRLVDGRAVLDFAYSLDEHGLRPAPGDPAGATILFFGCSFTFGIGLADDETLPAQLSLALGLRYNVRNLAFNGYGPHHMLHLLEQGLPAGIVGGGVQRIFYVAIPDQVSRAAGLAWWGKRAPHYSVGPDGEARLQSREFAWPLPITPPQGLRNSRLAIWAWSTAVAWLKTRTEWQLDLFEAILRKANRLARQSLGVPLTVVLWDDGSELSNGIRERLARLGLETILVSQALPADRGAVYTMPGDGHPTALANRLLARRLAELIE